MTDTTPDADAPTGGRRAAPPLAPVAVRRARAWRRMHTLTAACLVVALAVSGQQLATQGWATFVARPDGVGASESDGDEIAAELDVVEDPPATTTPATSADDATLGDGPGASDDVAADPVAPRPRRDGGRRPPPRRPPRRRPPRPAAAAGR